MALDLDGYARIDAVARAARVRSDEVSAREVAELAVSVMERLNPQLNAVVLADVERALAAAAQVDRSAPLAGVPFLVKDVDVFVAEWPTTFSSRYFADAAPRSDSEIVRRWRDAGLVLLGKTNTPEFAGEFVTEPALRDATLNPWNPAVTVGGSSGGAAAAVASGMVPAAHGTDVGGSIRVPAACCGLFGLKPTRGLNPIGPHYPELGAGLDCEHVLTRTVRDSAAFLDATLRQFSVASAWGVSIPCSRSATGCASSWTTPGGRSSRSTIPTRRPSSTTGYARCFCPGPK